MKPARLTDILLAAGLLDTRATLMSEGRTEDKFGLNEIFGTPTIAKYRSGSLKPLVNGGVKQATTTRVT